MSDELVTLEDDDQVLDVELENYNVPVQEDVIHSGTTAYWEAQPTLVGEVGHIYAYTDYVNIDEEDVPAIKVGDGTTLLSNLPFVSGNNDILNAHITNTDIHVTAAEKETWNAKVSPEEGKGLSTNDFTNELKAKLEGIEAGAEANVQADWSQTLTTADNFIKNKPSIPENTSDLVNDSGFITAALAPVQGVKGSAESAYRKGNVSISKTDIGLGNVDNTADADKPISTATQAALNAKITNPSGGTAGQVLTKTVNGEEWADTGSVKSVNTIAPVNGDVTLGKGDVGLGNVTNDAQVKRTEMGTANGVATLDTNGVVPSAQLPSFVDDVLEYASASAFPETGETGKIYVALDTNLTYRWGGSAYVEISESLALGETSSTAYAGNKGKATTDALNTHLEDNVRHITNAERTSWNNKVDKEAGKSLSSNDFTTAEKEKLAGIAAGAEVNVQANWNESDQTSDAFIQNKPSIPSKTSELTNDSGFVTNTAMQSALDQKVDKVAGKGLSTEDFTSTEKTKLAGIETGAQVNTITGVKGDAETDYRTGNVNITKENIGLGNVDNTSDLDKPISTAVQTALDGKQATLTFDTTPTAGSTNPVTSGGIAAEISALNSKLSQKANASDVTAALAQKQDKLTFDTEPTENSQNPVTSGGIFLSQKAQDRKFDTLADLLNAKYADDWATIQAMVQIGYGAKYYPVGTQFTAHHDVYGDVLFDVIHHITPESDALHKAMLPTGAKYGMVLQMHNVIYSTQFDEVEGFYYCEDGMTAGTYNVTITRQPWFEGDVGKTFQFTLADDVPAGAILCWDGYNVTREGRTVRVYNTRGAISAAQTATMTEGNGGTALGSVDGTGNFNFFDRSVLGSNDWEESGVRQWLNADVASNWWEPKTKWDRLVNYYSRPGFLFGFGTDFKNVLVETTHGNRSNTVFDSHGTNKAYSTTEKIFLLCNEEVNLAQEQGIVCGKVFDYYKDAANADRIKYDITSTGTARVWWLRSPYPSTAFRERLVLESGELNSDSALYGNGVVAACVIAQSE